MVHINDLVKCLQTNGNNVCFNQFFLKKNPGNEWNNYIIIEWNQMFWRCFPKIHQIFKTQKFYIVSLVLSVVICATSRETSCPT